MSSYLPRTITRATLYSLVGTLSEIRHVLTTEDDFGIKKTIQNTYKDSQLTDKQAMEQGLAWCRQYVTEDIPVSYSNNKGILLEGKNLTRVAETLNEAYQAHENSDPFNRLLLG